MAARPGTTSTRLATARSFARAVRAAIRPGSAGLGTRLAALPRLVGAIRRGEYGGASVAQVMTLLASAVYIASPVDVLPEGILGVFGLGDDALVLAYAASAFVNLTEDFLAWERGAATQPSSTSSTSSASSSWAGPRSDASRTTVRGTVIG